MNILMKLMGKDQKAHRYGISLKKKIKQNQSFTSDIFFRNMMKHLT